jgi:hypothetical protein
MSNQNSERRSITPGELLAASIVVIGAVLSFWISTSTRLTALEIRIGVQEETNKQVNSKLDKLQDGINEIKVTLQNKQDRPAIGGMGNLK